MNTPRSRQPQGPMHEEARKAMREMIGDVIAEHKRFGLPLTIMRDDKIIEISPEEAETEWLAHKEECEATHDPVPDAYRFAPEG